MTDIDSLRAERAKLLRKDLVESCTICKGKGSVDGNICSCEINFKNCVKLDSGGFPLDLQYLLNKDVEKFEELFNGIPVLQYFAEHPVDVREKGLSLYIHGELGVGKGLCSLWAAKKYCASYGIGGTEKYKQHGMRFAFVMAVDFINNAKIFLNAPEKLEEIYSASFLVLDDFSNEYKKASNPDFVHRIYEKLFRDRLSNCLPTIITTNIPPWSVADKYDERIASLLGIEGEEEEELKMSGRYASVFVEGTDFRQTDESWSKFTEAPKN